MKSLLFLCIFMMSAAAQEAAGVDQAKGKTEAGRTDQTPVQTPVQTKDQKPATNSQVSVTLFGQPCQLQGPADQGMLKAIHAVSPEQLYPSFGKITKDSLNRAIEKIRNTKKLPAPLETYSERMTKWLEAQAAFTAALEGSKKTRSPAPLVEMARRHVQEKRVKDFEEAAKYFVATRAAKNKEQEEEALNRLSDSFGGGLGSDPQEEFHRAIDRLEIRYVCAFEDDSEDDEDQE